MDDDRLNLAREVTNYLLRLKRECSFLQAKASAFSIIRSSRTEGRRCLVHILGFVREAMTVEMLIVLALLVAGITLWVTEKLPVDLVALGLMAVLMITGIITPEEGIAGFSNTATVTVGAMFILSAGLFKTGALNFFGMALTKIGKRSFWLLSVSMMVMIAFISAFINNTAAVALFLPVVLTLSDESGISPSKLLMPLSFSAMFGGMCTLIGTSTNVLASSITEAHGMQPLGMFEFTRLGIVFTAVGILYMFLAGIRLIPPRRSAKDLTGTFEMKDYLTEIVLMEDSVSIGKPALSSPLVKDLDIDIIEVIRGKERMFPVTDDVILRAGDTLRVRANVHRVKELQLRKGIRLKSDKALRDRDLERDDVQLIEAVIAPGSELDGTSLKEAQFRNRYGATALAIRHRGALLHENIGTRKLTGGDTLLVEATKDTINRLKRNETFVLVSDVVFPKFRRKRTAYALLIIAAVIVVAALEILPIVIAAVTGCILLVITGCLTLEESYQAIEWKVIFLLAGALTLGVAMEKTGLARFIASQMVVALGAFGPWVILSAFYLLTMVFTETMSNNATAALLIPIAIVTAQSLGVDARPFIMAVTFAASASFMTPVGYQTNTLIYGPGHYAFRDFLRVGTPLNMLFWLIATWAIPVIWPFYP